MGELVFSVLRFTYYLAIVFVSGGGIVIELNRNPEFYPHLYDKLVFLEGVKAV